MLSFILLFILALIYVRLLHVVAAISAIHVLSMNVLMLLLVFIFILYVESILFDKYIMEFILLLLFIPHMALILNIILAGFVYDIYSFILFFILFFIPILFSILSLVLVLFFILSFISILYVALLLIFISLFIL